MRTKLRRHKLWQQGQNSPLLIASKKKANWTCQLVTNCAKEERGGGGRWRRGDGSDCNMLALPDLIWLSWPVFYTSWTWRLPWKMFLETEMYGRRCWETILKYLVPCCVWHLSSSPHTHCMFLLNTSCFCTEHMEAYTYRCKGLGQSSSLSSLLDKQRVSTSSGKGTPT